MRQFVGLAFLLLLGFTPLSRGESPIKKAAAGPSLEDLVQQLGDRDFQVREKASKTIRALGIEALPALQKRRAAGDPEVRRRLDELIPPLERAITLMPRRLTLHMTNKPIRAVLAEISKQTGYRLATWP